MTVQVYSDAACNAAGCAWGGVLLGPGGVLVTQAGALAGASHLQNGPVGPYRAELRAAVRVVALASELWPGESVDLNIDCDPAVSLILRARGGRLRDPWYDALLEPLRRGDLAVRWTPREDPGIALCDALADEVLAAPGRRRGARQRTLIATARALAVASRAPWCEVGQDLVRRLHRTDGTGARPRGGWPLPAGYRNQRERKILTPRLIRATVVV